MLRRGHVRPSKPVSLITMVVGIGFVLVGLFVAIPGAGIIGVIWTLLALGITVLHAHNLFTDRGVPTEEVEFDLRDEAGSRAADDFDTKLRKLAKLHEDGLVTDEEFERKRAEIVAERW